MDSPTSTADVAESTAFTGPDAPPAGAEPDGADGTVMEDLLVEDVSIDGMCGVY